MFAHCVSYVNHYLLLVVNYVICVYLDSEPMPSTSQALDIQPATPGPPGSPPYTSGSCTPVMPPRTPLTSQRSPPNWPENFKIPWNLLPCALVAKLELGERPRPKEKRNLVQIICTAMMSVVPKPKRHETSIIAQRAVSRYPGLQDTVDDLDGNGYQGLLNMLQNRIENQNRDKLTFRSSKRRLEPTSPDDNDVSVMVDSYGCINFQPLLPTGEMVEQQTSKKTALQELQHQRLDENDKVVQELLQATYASQRCDINGGASVTDIQKEWPLLLSHGIPGHFEKLTGVPLQATTVSTLDRKGVLICEYFKSLGGAAAKKEVTSIFADGKTAAEEGVSRASLEPALAIMLVMAHMHGKRDALFLVADVSKILSLRLYNLNTLRYILKMFELWVHSVKVEARFDL